MSYKNKAIIFLTSFSITFGQEVNLSPLVWGEGEIEKYLKMDTRNFPDNPVAIGKNGAVTTTFHSAASRAGLEALNQGGSSVDAAMTAALTQITLNAGSVVSFFGVITMVHYDAATGEMVSMDAAWNTVQDELDPISIPGPKLVDVDAMWNPREVSGRTALVGGFMRGVEEANAKYGKLPFRALFDPAIYFAENGFELSPATADFFKRRDLQIRRREETRETLVKSNGSGYKAGDLFVQTKLANTLKNVAENGADYMYLGKWAENAVKAVQSDGGKMTMKDLADYRVLWNQPIRSQYEEYEVAVLGPPTFGSINLIEALNLAYAAGIPELGHWSTNGSSLKLIADVTSNMNLSYLTDDLKKMIYPGLDLSNQSRLKKETAVDLWNRMDSGVKLITYANEKRKLKVGKIFQYLISKIRGPKHSDTVVAIDQWGNMTAVTHTINCIVWGNEAIMVDGVSIGDAASFQQAAIKATGPGNRLPSPIEVGIISKNGKPIIPFASMSMGLHQQTVQSILNIIAFDMSIEDAVNAPSILYPETDASDPKSPKTTVRVMEGDFSEKIIKESGLPISKHPAKDRRYMQGLWVGIYRNPETGLLEAVSPPYATGVALAK